MLAVFRQGSRNDQAVICKYKVKDENMMAESQPLYYFFPLDLYQQIRKGFYTYYTQIR